MWRQQSTGSETGSGRDPGEAAQAADSKVGHPKRYLTRVPSARACARERDHLRELINARRSHVPIPELIAQVNAQVLGWEEYFRHGHSRSALRALNWYLQQRMTRHLKRRSQPP